MKVEVINYLNFVIGIENVRKIMRFLYYFSGFTFI